MGKSSLLDSFAGYGILGWQIFFSFNIFNISSHYSLTWIASWGIPFYVTSLFFLLLSEFSLTFDNLIVMYLSVALFGLNLFGVPWALWICTSIFLLKSGKFLGIIALNLHSVFIAFSSPPGIPIVQLLILVIVSYWSHRFSSLFSLFFPFTPLIG